MYVRVTRVRSAPDRLDQGIASFEQQVVPATRQEPGFMGAALVVNRETGEATAATYWDTLDALNASEQVSTRRRVESTGSFGAAVMDVDRFEVVIFDRPAAVTEAKSGTFLRMNELYAQPTKLDQLINFMRERAPSVLQQQGSRAMVMGVNRMTGHTFVNSVWETAADRETSEAAVAGLRKEAGEVAGGQVVVTLGEGVFVELKQMARIG